MGQISFVGEVPIELYIVFSVLKSLTACEFFSTVDGRSRAVMVCRPHVVEKSTLGCVDLAVCQARLELLSTGYYALLAMPLCAAVVRFGEMDLPRQS